MQLLRYHAKVTMPLMMLFNDDDDVQEVAEQSAISKMMLTKWFKINQESKVARCFTFDQFP